MTFIRNYYAIVIPLRLNFCYVGEFGYNINVLYVHFQGVIKHIIPAVASTNAVIAAAMALEAFKIATQCANPLQNYMVFNQTDSIYTYAYEVSDSEIGEYPISARCRVYFSTLILANYINCITRNLNYRPRKTKIVWHVVRGNNLHR